MGRSSTPKLCTVLAAGRRLALAAALATMGIALTPPAAPAQMIPIDDVRETSVYGDFMGAHKEVFLYPPAPWAVWNAAFASINIPNPDPDGPGSLSASAFQVSEFFPGGINMSGSTGGGWSAPSGDYSALSSASFTFRLDRCHEYKFDAWYEAGDPGTESRIRVDVPGTPVLYENVTTAEVHTTGRLPAGTYEVEGHSYVLSSNENTQGPTYSIIWVCTPCVTTLVRGGPRSLTVACGANAVFSVEPNAAGLTYQWRRNLQPLTNSSHISGATSQTLTINNACDADADYYDVVLSDGTILEPSQLAQLTISTVSGVDAPSEGPEAAFSIRAAGPNPTSGPISFRYNAAVPRHVTIGIYNAAGARIRTLVRGMASGSGTVTWDGNLESGVRAPAGIYFLRVEAGSIHESRKVVLVR